MFPALLKLRLAEQQTKHVLLVYKICMGGVHQGSPECARFGHNLNQTNNFLAIIFFLSSIENVFFQVAAQMRHD